MFHRRHVHSSECCHYVIEYKQNSAVCNKFDACHMGLLARRMPRIYLHQIFMKLIMLQICFVSPIHRRIKRLNILQVQVFYNLGSKVLFAAFKSSFRIYMFKLYTFFHSSKRPWNTFRCWNVSERNKLVLWRLVGYKKYVTYTWENLFLTA